MIPQTPPPDVPLANGLACPRDRAQLFGWRNRNDSSTGAFDGESKTISLGQTIVDCFAIDNEDARRLATIHGVAVLIASALSTAIGKRKLSRMAAV